MMSELLQEHKIAIFLTGFVCGAILFFVAYFTN